MNSILLFTEDFIAEGRVRLTGRRLAHVWSVHRAQPGRTLQVGMVDGLLGEGAVVHASEDNVELDVHLSREPPPALPLVLTVSLPRPKSLRKVLHVATAMGVKQIHFVNAHRVEKSYWQSPKLTPGAVREILVLGLEQAVDTVMPSVRFHKRLRWFIEDDLPVIAAGKRALVAHPPASEPCPRALQEPSVLVLGPEGGLTDYEVGYFADAGFGAVSMGPRILRVEEAVAALLGRLY